MFQIFVVIYTGYIAFTNYGDSHNSTKEDAIAQIIRTSQSRVPDSPPYTDAGPRQGDEFGLLVTEPGGGLVRHHRAAASKKSRADGLPKARVDGYDLNSRIVRFQDEVLAVASRSPTTRTTARSAPPTASPPTCSHRPSNTTTAADTFTDTENGTVYVDDGEGNFRGRNGETLTPGWRVDVGWTTSSGVHRTSRSATHCCGSSLWTFAFAILSVVATFALGLFLAIVFNHPRTAGQEGLPHPDDPALRLPGVPLRSGVGRHAQPGVRLSSTRCCSAAPTIGWLTDPWLARFSVLVVNLWLGFPYMFLVCTGALQSLPDELDEAARIDGAGAWRVFRSIKLPLLFVSVAPLLIASFAFNFNNFNVIYMLTRRRPALRGHRPRHRSHGHPDHARLQGGLRAGAGP